MEDYLLIHFCNMHSILIGSLPHESAMYCTLLKSILVHLDPGSQLVCLLMQMLVIVTTIRIFVANLRTELCRVRKGMAKVTFLPRSVVFLYFAYGTYS